MCSYPQSQKQQYNLNIQIAWRIFVPTQNVQIFICSWILAFEFDHTWSDIQFVLTLITLISLHDNSLYSFVSNLQSTH